MCGYFCIEFINYMLKGKTLLDYTNLFSPNDFKKNDRVIKSKKSSSKKSRFIKEHQAMGLLSNLGIQTPLSQVPLLNVLL